MDDLNRIHKAFELTDEPNRRGTSEKNIRLESKGNFNRIVELTGAGMPQPNHWRGK
jgi:hypothetical protein